MKKKALVDRAVKPPPVSDEVEDGQSFPVSHVSLTTVFERPEKDTPIFVPAISVEGGANGKTPAGDHLLAYFGFRSTRRHVGKLTQSAKDRGNYLEIVQIKVDVQQFLDGGTIHLKDIHKTRLMYVGDASVDLLNMMLSVVLASEANGGSAGRRMQSIQVPTFLANNPNYLDVLRKHPAFAHITVWVVPGPERLSCAYIFPGAEVVDARILRTASCPVLLPEWLAPDTRTVKAPPLPKKAIVASKVTRERGGVIEG